MNRYTWQESLVINSCINKDLPLKEKNFLPLEENSILEMQLFNPLEVYHTTLPRNFQD